MKRTPKYPGWRTMTGTERYNARLHWIFAEAKRLQPYETGDGKRFCTEAEAIQHANNVAASTGAIISVEVRS